MSQNHLEHWVSGVLQACLPRVYLYSNDGVPDVSRTLNNARLVEVWKVTDASIGETTLREVHLYNRHRPTRQHSSKSQRMYVQ